MIDINVDLLRWFIKFLIKKTSGSSIENKNISVEELGENYTNQLLETLMKEMHTHLLLTVFGLLI